jgi:hypothetical protein
MGRIRLAYDLEYGGDAKTKSLPFRIAAANTFAGDHIYLSIIPNPVEFGKDTRFIVVLRRF